MLSLEDTFLVVLYFTHKASTQFLWNANVFLTYMWLSDCIPMRPTKFVATDYGAYTKKTIDVIALLNKKGFISKQIMALQGTNKLDTIINSDFFETQEWYVLSEAGEKRVQKLLKTYSIDKQQRIRNVLDPCVICSMDTKRYMEICVDMFPQMVLR